MLSNPQFHAAALRVAGFLHADAYQDAAREVVTSFKLPGVKVTPKTAKKNCVAILTSFLHTIMENGGMEEAAQILWTPTQFTPAPYSVKQVWSLFDRSSMGLIMGAAKMGKSFSMGVRLFLEWVRDPEYTTIKVVGPSENHLEQNLFSHLVSLHTNATLPMPGEVGDLFIGLDRRDQLSSIRGVVIPKGNAKKAGRLQGSHRRPRPKPHPLFGSLSRMFIFLDEIENVPDGIWHDIDNVLSEIEGESKGGFKIFGAYNPTDSAAKVAQRAEPDKGWANVEEDKDFEWRSRRGWDVVRIDGEQCENVLQDKIIFEGLQTRAGLVAIAGSAGGREGAGYKTMGRGMYPSMGIEATVIPQGMFPKWRGEFIWYRDPEPVAATDLALEGGDDAVHTVGLFGLASGIKFPPSIEHPSGHTEMFKKDGKLLPRWGLQAMLQTVLPKGDTVRMKESILRVLRNGGIKPEYYACDRTGHGSGVADLLKYEWSTVIHDVNYSQGSGPEKIMQEDSKTCEEQFERMYSVLWFAMRQWGEFQYLLIHPSMDVTKLTQQVTGRRFRVIGGRSKVESKADYKSRGFGSPNEADSLTLLVHAARKGSGLILSMRGNMVELPGGISDTDDWPIPGYASGVRVDPSNMADYLDTSMRRPGDMEPAIL